MMKMIVRPKDNLAPERVRTDRIMTIGQSELPEVMEVGRVILAEDVKKIIVIHLQVLLINIIHIIISRRQKQRGEELNEDHME